MSYLRPIAVLLLGASLARADHWPNWRGPKNDGHAPDQKVPLQWSPTENVRWKVALPSDGNSTPVIWGDRIFVTQAIDRKGTRRALLCLARDTGKLLWQKETEFKDAEPTHSTNPFCSASPVTDGERVVVSHGSAGMVCYDFEGKELWRKDLGKLHHIWGNASSPILYDDLAILWCGPGERQFLLAVNKRTGAKVWQHDEPGGKFGTTNKEWLGSWSTPIIAPVGNRDELILGVPTKVKGFDPKTGKELWSCDGLGSLVYTSPVCSADGIVVAMAGYGGAALAVRAGGAGDVTKTHRLWHHTKGNRQRIGSPVILGDNVYIVCEKGPAQCFDLKTGKEVGKVDRITEDKCWSTLVLIGNRFYLPCWNGDTYVLSADPKFEVLATNSLSEPILSSIAVSNGALFIRTYKHLWCIGAK
jgi:outer membrane protein assembly factor BamB